MQNITVAISHFVKQGQEQAFEEALKQVIRQAKTFKGYEGIQIIRPNNKAENEYLLLVRFDQEANYQRWRSSEAYAKWVTVLKRFIHKNSHVRYQDGLEFWFSSTEITSPKPPIKWKMALLTWLVIYPLIIGLSTLAGVLMGDLHPFLRMLIVSIILVGSMTYFIMPSITKVFSFWIFNPTSNDR